MNHSLWYVNQKGSLFEVCQCTTPLWPHEDVKIVSWEEGGSPYLMHFSDPILVTWGECNTEDGNVALRRLLGGATKIARVNDLPFFVHSGPVDGEEIGETRAWLSTSRDLAMSHLSAARTHGNVVPLHEVPVGSVIAGTTARLLIEYVYGQLCIDHDGDVYLGDWVSATTYHAEQVRKLMTQKPLRYHEDVGATLLSYFSDKRISDMDSHLRLACALFDTIDEAVRFVCLHWRIKQDNARLQEVMRRLVEDMEERLAQKRPG